MGAARTMTVRDSGNDQEKKSSINSVQNKAKETDGAKLAEESSNFSQPSHCKESVDSNVRTFSCNLMGKTETDKSETNLSSAHNSATEHNILRHGPDIVKLNGAMNVGKFQHIKVN